MPWQLGFLGSRGEVLRGGGADGWWGGWAPPRERCEPVVNGGEPTLFLLLFYDLSLSRSLPL